MWNRSQERSKAYVTFCYSIFGNGFQKLSFLMSSKFHLHLNWWFCRKEHFSSVNKACRKSWMEHQIWATFCIRFTNPRWSGAIFLIPDFGTSIVVPNGTTFSRLTTIDSCIVTVWSLRWVTRNLSWLRTWLSWLCGLVDGWVNLGSWWASFAGFEQWKEHLYA